MGSPINVTGSQFSEGCGNVEYDDEYYEDEDEGLLHDQYAMFYDSYMSFQEEKRDKKFNFMDYVLDSGGTLLDYVISTGHLEMAAVLVKHGAKTKEDSIKEFKKLLVCVTDKTEKTKLECAIGEYNLTLCVSLYTKLIL